MLVRKLGVVAVAAALLIGTAGCSITSNVATKLTYTPSDGSQTDSRDLHARNVLVLSDGDHAIIIGSITNDGEDEATTNITVTGGATATSTDFTVPARGKVDFGYPEALGFVGSQPAIVLEGVIPAVGSNIQVKFDNNAEAVMHVQVLDGTVPTYKDLMPFVAPTATPAATPVATPAATPAATPEATPAGN